MKKKPKIRIDQLLVEQGLAGSRERARALVMAGKVIVDQQKVNKAGDQVAKECSIRLLGQDIPYVSRGGVKLEGALKDFAIDVQGMSALDVGASTGGFTDCLLQRGAKKVYCVDVGYGQLDWSLRTRPEVVNFERVNFRYFDPALIPEPVDIVVIDVSFISLTKIIPKTLELLKLEGLLLPMVKPQFEVGKGEVGKGGLVLEPEKEMASCQKIISFCQEAGLEFKGQRASQLEGAKGNQEFFLCFCNHPFKS